MTDDIYNNAIILFNDKKYEEALELMIKCYYKEPLNLIYILKLAEIFVITNRFLYAIDIYNKYLNLQPNDIKVLKSLLLCYRTTENNKQIEQIYENILNIKNNDIESIESLLSLYYKLGECNKYDALFNKYKYIFTDDRKNILEIYNNLLLEQIMTSNINILYNRYKYENNIDYLFFQKKVINEINNIIVPISCPITFILAYHNKNNKYLFKKVSNMIKKYCPFINEFNNNFISKTTNDKKIKIGFISYFFRNHSVTKDRRGLIKMLDRDIFEVYSLFIGNYQFDDISNEIINCTHYVKINDDIYYAIKQIQELNLNILFYCEIGMCMLIYILAQFRLAPIQINTWDHSDTSGIDTIDYYISSKLYEKKNGYEHYSEKLIMNEGLCTYYYNPFKYVTEIIQLQYENFENKNIYFCPGSLFKIHSNMDIIFDKILNKDENALILFVGNDENRYKLENRFKNTLGYNTERTFFVDKNFNPNYFFSLLTSCNILLDSYFFGGCNSCLEAFSINKPVVTLPGNFINSRFTYGFYKKMNFIDLISENIDDYVNIAIKIAINNNYNKYVCNEIKRKKYILYENIETVYEWNDMLVSLIKSK